MAGEMCQEAQVYSAQAVRGLGYFHTGERIRKTDCVLPELLGSNWVREGVELRPSSGFLGQFPHKISCRERRGR